MNTLVYLLYGKTEEYHLELTYSVLSAIAAGDHRGFRIVLITDENTRRDDLPIEHLSFSHEELSDWTFGGRFNHSAKIGALMKAAARYDGKIALLDTDTYFYSSPSQIFDRIDDQHVVMHADEGSLGEGFPNYSALLEHEHSNRAAPYHFDPSTKMINSGVIGLSEKAKPVLTDAMKQTRYLVDLSRDYIHTLEQFSLGLTLGTHFKLRMSDDVVRHYHGYERRFIHSQIKELFPQFTQSGFEAALKFPIEIRGFPETRKIDVARSKLKAFQHRELNNYGFAYLCYLSALSAASPAEANAWAGTALDVIIHNAYPRDIVSADFAKLTGENRFDLKWIAPAVRERWSAFRPHLP